MAHSGSGGKGTQESPIPHCPPGLEYLVLINQIVMQQHKESIEAFTAFETYNKYIAMNAQGQFVYLLAETSDSCARYCCGPYRKFQMHVIDHRGVEVMRLLRPLRCHECCFLCCLQQVEVQAPPGVTIGFVRQDWTFVYPSYSICDASGRAALGVLGPLISSTCFGRDILFQVLTITGDEIGVISKHWPGFVKNFFTEADFFGVRFPLDLDVHYKACLIACAIFIDFMYFEGGCFC